MPRLSLDARKRAVELHQSRFSVEDIHARLREEKKYITKRSLQRLIKKYQQYRVVQDLPRRARPKKLTPEMVMFMNNELERNDEITAKRMRDELIEKWPTLQVRYDAS